MNRHAALILSPLLALSLQVKAHSNEGWLCSLNNAERQIDLIYLQPGQAVPCEVQYQREDGERQTLWSANNQAGYCETKTAEFIEQQRQWGWSCNLTTDQALPPESEPVAEEPVPVESEPTGTDPDPGAQADPASATMAELNRTSEFFQAYTVITPLRIAILEYHAQRGVFPSHLNQLSIPAEQLRDSPYIRDIRLTQEGVIFALGSRTLGDAATLKLVPQLEDGGLRYQWRCDTNVVVRQSPQCSYDETLAFPQL